MSQENVDLVLSLDPDVDFAQVARDDETWAAWVETYGSLYHPDCEFAFPGLLGGGKTYTGLEGGRAAWLDWLTAWTSYRVEVSEAIDCGERVLTLYDAFAVPQGSTAEVKLSGADVWTVRDGKIARWEGYGSHAKGRKVVGLEAEAVSQENVELVKRGWEHFKATGELLAELVAPDFIWDMSTFRDAVGGLDKQYEGAEGAHRFLREWREPFDEWQIDLERYHEAGDKVVTVCHQRARSKGSGVPVEMRFAFVITVRTGLMTRMEMYADPTEALKAVGLEA